MIERGFVCISGLITSKMIKCDQSQHAGSHLGDVLDHREEKSWTNFFVIRPFRYLVDGTTIRSRFASTTLLGANRLITCFRHGRGR